MMEKRPKSLAISKFIHTVQTINFMLKNQISSDDLQMQAKAALIKQTQHRNDHDFVLIERMMSRLNFSVSIKQKYGIELFHELCKNFQYQRQPEGTPIININKEGKTFYIILSGSVGVRIYVPIDNKCLNFEEKEINILKSGESFGELALLDSSSKTVATVVTKEICEFACLDRKQFQNILGIIKQKEIQDKIGYLKQLPFLKECFENDIKTLSYHFQPCSYLLNQTIFQEGEIEVENIYFVKQGSISLYKKASKVCKLLEMKKEIKQHKDLLVCTLGILEQFGEESFFAFTQRQFTAKSDSQETEVYKISKYDLERRLWLNQTRIVFKTITSEKWQWRLKRFFQAVQKTDCDRPESQGFDPHFQMLESILTPENMKTVTLNLQEPKQNSSFIDQESDLSNNPMFTPSQKMFQIRQAKKLQNYMVGEEQQISSSKIKKQNSEAQIMIPHLSSNLVFIQAGKGKSPEQQVEEFLKINLNPELDDKNIVWGDDGTIEKREKKIKEFYQTMKFYSNQQSTRNRNIIEANSTKAKQLEIAYKQLRQHDQDNYKDAFKQTKPIGLSDNKIRQEYFLKQLKKMQKRLKVLQMIKKGVLQCGKNQYVNDEGQIVDIENDDEETEMPTFNFISKGSIQDNINKEVNFTTIILLVKNK